MDGWVNWYWGGFLNTFLDLGLLHLVAETLLQFLLLAGGEGVEVYLLLLLLWLAEGGGVHDWLAGWKLRYEV